jgi:phosphonate transport system substrate-binding protein
MHRRFLLAATVSALAFSALPAAAETSPIGELNFGILSTESQQNLKSRYTEFLADMEKSLGIKVNAFFASDYAGVVEAMRFGKVQVAVYGNASAIVAVDRASGEVFGKTLEVDGSDGYYSHVVVNKDSPIRDFEDLRKSPGRYSFSNGDPNSTSGFLVPSYYAWALNNIDIRHHFTRVVSANHESNALAVANHQVDVATCNSETLRRLGKSNPAKLAELRVIWTSPLIPLNPVVWRTDLAPDMKEKLQAFLFTYGVAEPGKSESRLAHEQAVLTQMVSGGFRASSDKQLIPLREIGLFRDRMAVDSENISEDAKAAKRREIDAKLKQLQRDANPGS